MQPTNSPSASGARSHFRVVLASFGAGVGAVAVAGLLASFVLGGGLNLAEAKASQPKAEQVLIAPLDVEAVQESLNEADVLMSVSRRDTHRAMSRLERLSGV